MTAAPLELNGLTKRYGKHHGIEDINLTIKTGEVFGFLGPNGAGKTTTIRTVMNFLRPSAGSARVFGLDSKKDSVAIKGKVGYLSGDIELYNNLSGRQYLTYIANLHKIKDMKVLTELEQRLDVTLDQKIRTLSRGNKQKVGLAAALVHDPDLLILDEPTSGLDPLMQNEFYGLMRERTKRGKTVFISSHILSEVQEICDRVGFMKQGRLIETIDVAQLLSEARKQITVRPKRGTKIMKLPTLNDIKVIKQTDKELIFTIKDSQQEILRWLSVQPVHDVTITNASLDQVFLKLYGDSTGEKLHV